MNHQHDEPDNPDPLSAARGCINGILLSIPIWLLLFWAGGAFAQTASTTVTLESLNSTWAFRLSVANTSDEATITSTQISISTGRFDQISVGAVTPEVADNNDGVHTQTITAAMNVPPGQTGEVLGDIDPNAGPSNVVAVVTFSDGNVLSFDVPNEFGVFTASASINSTPGPIINGQADVTLTWTPPTQNEDGTPLGPNELAGYVVYWDAQSRLGRCSEQPAMRLDPCYANALDLADGSISGHQFTIPLSGDTDVYFAGAAYKLDEDGVAVLSRYSNEVLKQFRVTIEEPQDPPPAAPNTLTIDIQITCTTDTPEIACSFTVN